jgi:hypothetical protein
LRTSVPEAVKIISGGSDSELGFGDTPIILLKFLQHRNTRNTRIFLTGTECDFNVTLM